MLQQAEDTTGIKAQTTLADAGYHSGSNLEECASRDQQVVMPEAQHKALKRPYHKDRFTYDESTDSYSLGQSGYEAHSWCTPMRMYRASATVCRRCPAFGVCTRDRRRGRALEIGPHDEALRSHRAWMRTEKPRKSIS